jgi:branched-chain amino acid transport system permease protein
MVKDGITSHVQQPGDPMKMPKSRISQWIRTVLVSIIACTGLSLFASPASADSANADLPYSISGTVSESGAPLEGVKITVTGPSMAVPTEVLTAVDGSWSIGVPEKNSDYEVKLDTETLPAGSSIVDDPDTTAVESSSMSVRVGPGGRVALNFFLGDVERATTSLLDQLLSRIINGVNFGLMLALASIGLSLIYGTTGISNFAHAEMVTFGALASLNFVQLGAPVWIALIGAVALSAFFGWGMDAALWAPLRRRNTGLVQLMIVSIGLSLAVRYTYQLIIGGGTEQLPGADSPKLQLFGSISLSWIDIASMVISVFLLAVFAWWLLRTRIGKATRAISDNPSLAAASGINVDAVVRVVWIVGSALAGFSGILWAFFRPGIRWDMGGQILLLMFAATTLGGLGTAWGALIGSIIVGILVETSTLVIPSDLKYVGALVILIVILLFRPQGIMGRKERVG